MDLRGQRERSAVFSNHLLTSSSVACIKAGSFLTELKKRRRKEKTRTKTRNELEFRVDLRRQVPNKRIQKGLLLSTGQTWNSSFSSCGSCGVRTPDTVHQASCLVSRACVPCRLPTCQGASVTRTPTLGFLEALMHPDNLNNFLYSPPFRCSLLLPSFF